MWSAFVELIRITIFGAWIGNLALPDALLIALVTALGAGSMLLLPRPAAANTTSSAAA